MTTQADLTVRLAAARARLLRALVGVTEEQFKRRPAVSESDPTPWCIAEVLAHLLATEGAWAARIRLALDDDGAVVTATDPAATEAQVRAGRLAPVPQLIHGLLAVHREVDLLIARAASEGAFERGVLHPRHGWISVAWMLETWQVAHTQEHAEQIEALRVAVGARPVDATAA